MAKRRKATPGNHRFVQGLLGHGLDLRPLQNKRTAKRGRPTEECATVVELTCTPNSLNAPVTAAVPGTANG
jgi:hypothetical protein